MKKIYLMMFGLAFCYADPAFAQGNTITYFQPASSDGENWQDTDTWEWVEEKTGKKSRE